MTPWVSVGLINSGDKTDISEALFDMKIRDVLDFETAACYSTERQKHNELLLVKIKHECVCSVLVN